MRRRDAGADPSCKRGRRLGPLLGALRGRLAPRCEDCSFGDTRDRRGPGRAPQRLLGGRSGQKRPELQPQGDRRQASRPAAARGGQARGRRLGSRRPVSRPSRTLGTPRGWLSAASQGEPGGLGGRPGLGAALCRAVVASTPGGWGWARARWEPHTIVTHRGSSHLLPTPQTGWGDAGRGSVPAGAAAFLPSPAPALPCVHPSALAAHRLSKKKRSCRL